MDINQFNLFFEAIAKLNEAKINTQIAELIAKSTRCERPDRSADLTNLFTALAKAQAEMQTAGLSKENPYFKSRYADLAEVVRASRPSLTKHGLSVMQQILTNEDGQQILYTILGHNSGQFIESRMRIVPPKNDIQTLGSYITYLKRYSYAALVGLVATDEDDDGEVAMIAARDIVAKGPSTKYNPKDQSFETISKDQLDELEYELAEYPDLAEEIMDKMRIQSLSDLPKNKYQISLHRIREIKNLRNNGK